MKNTFHGLKGRVLGAALVTGMFGIGSTFPALAGPAQDAPPADEPQLTLSEWSERVWHSARAGDTDAVRKYLRLRPVGFENDQLREIQDGLESYRTNRSEQEAQRHEDQQTALENLRKELKEGNLSTALKAAVEFQSLADSFDEALKQPGVQEVIARAKIEIPRAEEQRDWLYAQELLFRLRTLYEDTSKLDLYNKYDKALKALNRRVALLQMYAPKELYELRNQLAKRLGEEPLPDFNPNLIEGWEERVDGVNMPMVAIALRATASEHIESGGADGWRPLIAGGLHAMETLATTTELSHVMPGLERDHSVERFLNFVHTELDELDQTSNAKLNFEDLQEILLGLEQVNAQSINIPREVLLREFGDGAMFELAFAKEDEYSAIVWPDELRRFRQQTEGNFVGVGIIIRHNEKRDIVVVNPIEGTPAFRAGIRPDDIIVRVNGESTVGWSLNHAVDEITGAKGTVVELGIRREGEDKTLTFAIRRDQIKLPSVKGWEKKKLNTKGEPVWDWFVDPANRIGYVRLTSFSEDTYEDLQSAWSQMHAEGARGLILDLRHNPGGLLDQAWSVANMFIPSGEIVSIEGKDAGERETLRALPGRAVIAEADIPVAVLVNKGSASASEIVSGALQAHEAAIIVGTRTYGKGSVQRVYGIANNARLKLTTQYYRLPPADGETIGRIVHKRPNSEVWGVDPDVLVEMTPAQIVAALDVREAADAIGFEAPATDVQVDEGEDEAPADVHDLIDKGLDPQLQTALLILQARVAGELASTQARLH